MLQTQPHGCKCVAEKICLSFSRNRRKILVACPNPNQSPTSVPINIPELSSKIKAVPPLIVKKQHGPSNHEWQIAT